MKILYCDDDPFMRTVVYIILESAGNQVQLACDGQGAFEKLQADAFDVLITDNTMPRLNGIELVEKLRAKHVPIRVIMASTFSTQSDVQVQDRLQLDGLLKKPFTRAELLDCVNSLAC